MDRVGDDQETIESERGCPGDWIANGATFYVQRTLCCKMWDTIQGCTFLFPSLKSKFWYRVITDS